MTKIDNNLNASSINSEQLFHINNQYRNMLEPIIQQQNMIVSIVNSPIQQIIEQRNLLNQITIPKIEIPFLEIQRQYTEIISNFQTDITKQLINMNYFANIQTQILEVTQVNNILSETVKQMNLQFSQINNVWKNLDLSAVIADISKVNLSEIEYAEEQSIRETVNEVLEGYDLLSSQKRIEEKINLLHHELISIKKSMSNLNTIKLSVIASMLFYLISFIFNPLMEPLEKEYNDFVHQNGRTVIKEIQEKASKMFEGNLKSDHFKIISSKKLIVRLTNKRNSNVVGELYFGQLVQVVEKKRNWTKISYVDYEGNRIEGWVYTRYLSNIVK